MHYGFNCIMMFTCQEQSSSLPFTCNFYYSLRILVIFLLPLFHIPHCTAQIMDSERAGVLLAAVTSNAKHFCMVVFHAFFAQHRNYGNSFAFYSPFLDEGNRDWRQRVVFFPEMRCFLPRHRF